MGQVQYGEPLSRAIEHTKRILFRPFDLGKWFVLGFGCWLANLADSGGGGGSSWTTSLEDASWNGLETDFESWQPWLFSLVGCVIVFVLALIVVLLWLSSRGQFIFLDNVLLNRGAVREPWTRYKTLGNSLFLWQLVFIATVILTVLLVVLFTAALIWPWSEDPEPLACFGLLVGGLTFFAVILAAVWVQQLLIDFVVPIMQREGLRTTAAWQRFLPFFRANVGYFLLYALFVLLLWIGVGVGILFVIVFTCCLAAIPLILPYIGTVALLPIYVTFRAFSLEFLSQFSPELAFFTPASEPAVDEG